jgi:hypothetical protein
MCVCVRARVTFLTPWIAASMVLIFAAGSVSGQPSQPPKAAEGTPATQAAADDCLAKPTSAPPRGSHWFYRTERPSGRRCWYLGPDSKRAQRTDAVETKSAPATAAPVAPPPAQRPRLEPAPIPTTAPAAQPNAINWPAVPVAAQPSSRIDTASNDNAATPPRAVTFAEVATDRANEQSSEPVPELGPLVMIFFVTLAFIAVAFRATLKLWSAWRARRRRRRMARYAQPTVQRHATGRHAVAIKASPESNMWRSPYAASYRDQEDHVRRRAIDLDHPYGDAPYYPHDGARAMARNFSPDYAHDPATADDARTHQRQRRRAVA